MATEYKGISTGRKIGEEVVGSVGDAASGIVSDTVTSITRNVGGLIGTIFGAAADGGKAVKEAVSPTDPEEIMRRHEVKMTKMQVKLQKQTARMRKQMAEFEAMSKSLQA